jgi:sec-independent protein translocase protein TatB
MFDIAWSELALIGAVALVVIGPKDLPKVMRTMGKWTRKARLLASEFQRNFDDMVRQAELDDLRKQVQGITPAAVKSRMEDLVGAQDIRDALQGAPGPAATPAPAAPVAVDPPPPPAAAVESQAAVPPPHPGEDPRL